MKTHKKEAHGWKRAFPERVRCSKAILGHGMLKRRDVKKRITPFIADPDIMLPDGHAFRKSLCEGKYIFKYRWVVPEDSMKGVVQAMRLWAMLAC